MDPRQKPLYYADYLKLGRLLDCQELESAKYGDPAHDEMLFIHVHQVYELWFKQILWELDAVLRIFRREGVAEADMGRAVAHLQRVETIQPLLLDQIGVLETMTPLDFLDFRDYLYPASGFQSVQFRIIEAKLGLREQDRVQFGGTTHLSRLTEPDRERIRAVQAEPSLFDLVERWLERTPFVNFAGFDFWQEYRGAVERMLQRDRDAVAENPSLDEAERATQLQTLASTLSYFGALFEGKKHDELVAAGHRRLSHRALKAALLIHIYREEPILQLPFRLLHSLVTVDESFTAWRYRHALMVQRMIGTKIGTGGSSGHEYLRRTAERHKVFADLTNLSTYFIPRSERPELPDHVRKEMGFRLG